AAGPGREQEDRCRVHGDRDVAGDAEEGRVHVPLRRAPVVARNAQGLLAERRGDTIRLVAEPDFMPLDGWDHVELWVGNAKQAAVYYEHAFGFTRTPYAGPQARGRGPASDRLAQGA